MALLVFAVIPAEQLAAGLADRAVAAERLEDASVVVILARGAAARERAAGVIREFAARHPGAVAVTAPPAHEWPFRHPLAPALPDGPVVVWAPDAHEACINHQTGSTRLVTTQAPYLFEVWTAELAGRPARLVATVDPDVAAVHAPEIRARRGVFGRATILEADGDAPPSTAHEPEAPGDLPLLARAMRVTDPAERLALSVDALNAGRTAPVLVAAASTCMEVNDLEAAARDLDEALALAPEWAAAHFERGKLWLRVDDMERACASFRAAAERLPGFSPAWANLGATEGELDRPEAALAAFEQALAHDPASHQALNNIGVVRRELGRLPESEAAFRQVIGLVPDLAFGYYNLGHTLFLQGRYHAALSAYADGQRRDVERNPVQASRLALCRLATGDAAGALRDLEDAVGRMPRELRGQLLAETQAIAWALLTHKPDLPGWKLVHDWVNARLAAQG